MIPNVIFQAHVRYQKMLNGRAHGYLKAMSSLLKTTIVRVGTYPYLNPLSHVKRIASGLDQLAVKRV